MILIIAHHYVVNSGLYQQMETSNLTGNSLFLYLFGAWGKTGINCFVLITGYYMCKSSITLKKFFKLLFQVEFYKIVFFCIFLFAGYEQLSVRGGVKYLNPIPGLASNFTGCFIIFYLFIPFLTVLVNNLNEKKHRYLLLLTLGVYTILYTIPFIYIKTNYVTWFSVLFILGSYIRNYGIFPKIKTQMWGWLSIITLLLASASILIFRYFNLYPYRLVSDSNALFAVIVSVCLFMYFKGINIRHSSIINSFGGATFGVLLIHANSDSMRKWLWVDSLKNTEYLNSDCLVLHAIGSVILIFIICAIIDILRKRFVERPVFNYLDKFLDKSK